MTNYVCESKTKLPNWTCPDVSEEGFCGRPKITCPYRGEREA